MVRSSSNDKSNNNNGKNNNDNNSPRGNHSIKTALSSSSSNSDNGTRNGNGDNSSSTEKATTTTTTTTTRTPSTRTTRSGNIYSTDDNVSSNGNKKQQQQQRRRTANRNTNARSRRPNNLVARTAASRRIKRGRSGNRASFPWKNLDTDDNNNNNNDDDNHAFYTNNGTAIVRQGVGSSNNDANNNDSEAPIAKKTRSRKRTFSIRPMLMKDMATVYELGNSIFTAAEYPNMYRTWDDFAVVGNFANSAEFCFVAIGEHSKNSNHRHMSVSDNDNDDDGDGDNNNHNINSDDFHHSEKNSSSNDGDDHNDDDDEEIIGFLLGDSMTKSSIGTRGYIQWVAVESSYRRMRIATSLLEKFCDVADAENISSLLADTPADNTPAIRLFEKAGLRYKKDHVYLTKQLKEVETDHCDDDGYFDFHYSAKGNRVRIRPMEINDLHPIYAIGEKIFTSKNSNLFHFWDEQLVMHSYLSDPEYCVTATVKEDDGEESVVGFAFGTTIEKPRSSWRYGYLVWLGCHPDYQGLGLATQLYNVMVELFALEKVRMLMIDTQLDNVGALRFFRKIGFGHDEEHVYLSSTPMTETSIDLEVAAVAAEQQAIAEAEAEAEEQQQQLEEEQEQQELIDNEMDDE